MNKQSLQIIGIIVLCIFVVPFALLYAQNRQSLSVTPPLFQLNIGPGEIWQSNIRVVNNNPYELIFYAHPVNFVPEGEQGHGKFVPILTGEYTGDATLAEWITVQAGPYTIPPEQTKEVSFFVEIPEDAAPGGHFAAILISTESPSDAGERAIKTSQVVSSLFFVRIAGDIKENGIIREFTVDDTFVEVPEASFSLRFENKGNVHVQPRGNIVITNMWGKERGVVPINNQSYFGNVLPETIRKFVFSWKGEPSLTDIGRYKAIATLTFGEDAKQNVSATAYFWVVPIKGALITFFALAAIIFVFTWMIKLYVRRMLRLAGIKPATERSRTRRKEEIHIGSYDTMTAPIREGALDLRGRLSRVHKRADVLRTLWDFMLNYKYFFISIPLIAISILAAWYYFFEVSKDKSYEVIIDRDGEEVRVDSEEIIKDELQTTSPAVNEDQHFTLNIVNASGRPGVGAEVAVALEREGYLVTDLSTDARTTRERSVVIYDKNITKEAEAIGSQLGGALLSARPEVDSAIEESITIILGKDQI